MKKELEKISKALHRQGIEIDAKSIKAHDSQGLMSRVFILNSNRGLLILHLNKFTREQKRQKIWEKIQALSKILAKHRNIPTAIVYTSGLIGNKYFIVQSLLPGHVAGTRILDNRIIDKWQINHKKVEKQILNLARKINHIKISGAGWLIVKNGSLVGMYKKWGDFLEQELAIWTKVITAREGNQNLSDRINQYFLKVRPLLKVDKSVLVHGDLTNPSNILIQKQAITGLIDWEWSLAGDPAWEFAFNNVYDLMEMPISKPDEFIRRTKLYEPIYLAWGLYIHAKDPDQKLYRLLKKSIQKALDRLY